MKRILLTCFVFLFISAGALAQENPMVKKAAKSQQKAATTSKKSGTETDPRIAEKQKLFQAQNAAKASATETTFRRATPQVAKQD